MIIVMTCWAKIADKTRLCNQCMYCISHMLHLVFFFVIRSCVIATICCVFVIIFIGIFSTIAIDHRDLCSFKKASLQNILSWKFQFLAKFRGMMLWSYQGMIIQIELWLTRHEKGVKAVEWFFTVTLGTCAGTGYRWSDKMDGGRWHLDFDDGGDWMMIMVIGWWWRWLDDDCGDSPAN